MESPDLLVSRTHFSGRCLRSGVLRWLVLAAWFAGWVEPRRQALAQVPSLFHVQGRVLVGGSVFDGAGRFKFALVNADATQTYWRNAPDGDADGQPDQSVTLAVNRGLYAVALGDSAVANMEALTPAVFANPAVFLRVWFDDGSHGFQWVSPDQRVTAAGYALMAANVADGAVTSAKLAPGAVQAANIGGTLSPAQLPPNVAFRDLDVVTTSNALTAQLTALLAQLQALSNTVVKVSAFTNGGVATLPPGSVAASPNAADGILVAQGFARFHTFPALPWADLAGGGQAPAARQRHSAIWTGSEMVVWGGTLGAGTSSGSGASYNPALDGWTTVTSLDGPIARTGHSAVWTGSAMIVWGGFGGGIYLNTGASWRRSPQQWSALTTVDAPVGRDGHVAVWTGSRLVIWGGRNNEGLLGNGAVWNPANNQWAALPSANAPTPRLGAVGVLAGDRVVVWGGEDGTGFSATGAQLLLDLNGVPTGWQALPAGAPSARTGHSMVWTGSRVLIWGGRGSAGAVGDGAILDPAGAGAWEVMTATGAPSARSEHRAVWTGLEMLVHGGEDSAGALSSGAAFQLGTGTWRSLTTAGNPRARSRGTAIWTGTQLLVFGGQDQGGTLAAGQGLDPQPAWHLYRKP